MKTLGLVLGLAMTTHTASAKTYECTFDAVQSCASDISVFCAGLSKRERLVRIEVDTPGMPMTGSILQSDGQWIAIPDMTSDFQDLEWGQIFLFGSKEEGQMTVIVNKPSGAVLDFARPSPAIKYAIGGTCVLEGGA